MVKAYLRGALCGFLFGACVVWALCPNPWRAASRGEGEKRIERKLNEEWGKGAWLRYEIYRTDDFYPGPKKAWWRDGKRYVIQEET